MTDDSMTPEDWQRLSDLLNRARELEPEARAAFLDAACEDNDGLRSEADALLALDEPNTLLDRPIFNIQDGVLPIDPNLGLHLGPYELERRLGQGGMGTVYLARRRDEFDQKAAIKLIQRGMDSDDLLRRFRNERQILARLEHANIARLLDGGTADDGRPYFVMEYVDGEPVDRYCRRLDLSLRARLDLFRQICAAVHFSHQHLVVHRDLKPSNILIGAGFRVVVMDLGIARVLDHDSNRLVAGTPSYLAPELARGASPTPAADVYALAVMTSELLTGRLPFGPLNSLATIITSSKMAAPAPSAINPSLPREMDNAILAGLAKSPKGRPESATAYAQQVIDAATTSERNPRRLSFLVADDDPVVRELAVAILQAEFVNPRIRVASNGAEALHMLREEPADLAVVDLQMPELSGMDVTAQARAEPTTNAMPIIIMTAVGGASDWQVLASMGANAFVVKPFDQAQLGLAARRLLNLL